MKTPLIAIFFLWFSLLRTVSANNISISNVSITGQNVAAGVNNSANYSLIKFDVSWENSWRSSSLNWDAAWIFIKYRVNAGPWQHCNLNNTGHTAPSGSTIDAGLVTPSSAFNITSNPAVGAFIYRSADGNGTVNYQNVYLRWNYGSQSVPDNAILDIQAFAIEMVYVPTGEFAVGDGKDESADYKAASRFTITTINNPNATTIPTGSGSLGGQSGGYPTGQTAPNSSSWPNGYNSFYCMKYEITIGQYRDFLNTLTFTQQANRCSTSILVVGNPVGPTPNSYRNGLEVKTAGSNNSIPSVFGCDLNNNNIFDEASDGEWIAIGNINWADLASFLDWSCLRPMTELEFEKSCRGNSVPVSGEYAWGTNGLLVAVQALSNAGQINEGIANYSTTLGFGNARYGGNIGPSRVGIFAAKDSNSGRITAGASYYGIMELSGNVGEMAINLYLSSGRLYTGNHGNGILDVNGGNDVTLWPSTSSGIGARGGYFTNYQFLLEVSNRSYVSDNIGSSRNGGFAGRGVRTN